MSVSPELLQARLIALNKLEKEVTGINDRYAITAVTIGYTLFDTHTRRNLRFQQSRRQLFDVMGDLKDALRQN